MLNYLMTKIIPPVKVQNLFELRGGCLRPELLLGALLYNGYATYDADSMSLRSGVYYLNGNSIGKPSEVSNTESMMLVMGNGSVKCELLIALNSNSPLYYRSRLAGSSQWTSWKLVATNI